MMLVLMELPLAFSSLAGRSLSFLVAYEGFTRCPRLEGLPWARLQMGASFSSKHPAQSFTAFYQGFRLQHAISQETHSGSVACTFGDAEGMQVFFVFVGRALPSVGEASEVVHSTTSDG